MKLAIAIVLHVFLPLYLGLLTYQLRSIKPNWFSLIDPVIPIITILSDVNVALAAFIKWNLADMGWGWSMSASLLLIESKSAIYDTVWLTGYVLALGLEIGQIFGLPGTFDFRDLLALTAGYFIPIIFLKEKSS